VIILIYLEMFEESDISAHPKTILSVRFFKFR